MRARGLFLAAVLAGCTSAPVATSSAWCLSCDASGRMMIGGTQSLFLGEAGSGQFNRSVEATSGERIRAALTGKDPTATDFLEREAVELEELQSANPPAGMAASAATFDGVRREFLQAGVRRYAYVLQEASAHAVSDPCSYSGPLIPAGAENYDPRELCWWQDTLRLVDLL